MAKESGEWPKLADDISVPNESAEYFVNNGPFGTGNSTSGNVVKVLNARILQVFPYRLMDGQNAMRKFRVVLESLETKTHIN
jgi:hypothetical protein